MGYYYKRTNFSLRPQYSIDLTITTSYVDGGTQVYIGNQAVKHTYVNNTPNSTGSPRSYSCQNGRTGSVGGSLSFQSDSDSAWSFSFSAGSPDPNFVPQYQNIWGAGGFTRFYPATDTISTISVTASHSLLGSATSSVSNIKHVYRVSFNGNGGSSGASYADADSGDSITLPSATRTGYNFNGWYTASSGGTYRGGGGASYSVTGTTTLYAQWSPATPKPVFSDTSLGNYSYGVYNSTNSVAASDTNSYNWTSKPSWATADAGYLKGTPDTSGTFSWSVTATGDGGSTTLTGSSYVYYPTPTWSDSTMELNLRRGNSYSDSVSATIADGSTITYSSSVTSGSLVSGLTKGNNSLSGTPTSYGNFTIEFYATNTDNTSALLTKNFVVKDYLPVWSDSSISSGSFLVNDSYSDSITATNAAYYSYTGTMPPGITLNTATGVISGSFTTAGTYSIALRAYNNTDEYIATAQYTFTISDVGGRAFVFDGNVWVERDVMFWNGNWNTRGTVYYHDGNTWQKSIQ